MELTSGTSLLHYRLTAKLGVGGMGEVWRAADTTLGRDVAIKILPPAFAADAERLARFEREAKVLASLNHPNIAAIYGLHQAQGARFLAMEPFPGLSVFQALSAFPRTAALQRRLELSAPSAVSRLDSLCCVTRSVTRGMESTRSGRPWRWIGSVATEAR